MNEEHLETLWNPEVTPKETRMSGHRMTGVFVLSVTIVTLALFLMPDMANLLVNLYFIPIVASGYQWRVRGAIVSTIICLACYAVVLCLRTNMIATAPDALIQMLSIRTAILLFVGLVTSIASMEYQRILHRVRRYEMDTIAALARAIDAKDHYTHDHSGNVSAYSALIGKQLGLPPEEVALIRFKGLMHDVGKIGIEECILNKPDRLTMDEFTRMKQHVMIGVDILKRVDGLDLLIAGAHHHHERLDGTGYPEGLTAEQLSLHDRILGVADAYDAMTADRPYRKALPQATALLELKRCAGIQFDRDLVYSFIDALDVNGTLEDPSLKEHGPSASKN